MFNVFVDFEVGGGKANDTPIKRVKVFLGSLG